VSIPSLMNNSMTVYKQTSVSDVTGTFTKTASARFTSIPCRIQPRDGRDLIEAGSERVRVTHVIYTPQAYSTIDEEDYIIDADGNQYDFIHFIRSPEGMKHHVEIFCEQLKGIR